jgi:hypothetical protein
VAKTPLHEFFIPHIILVTVEVPRSNGLHNLFNRRKADKQNAGNGQG